MKTINHIRKTSNIPKRCRERYLNLRLAAAEPLNRIGVNFAGVSELRRGYRVGMPGPMESHMIIFTTDGEGRLMTPSDEFTLTRGTVIVVPAGECCEFWDDDDGWSITWFYLNPLEHWRTLFRRGVFFWRTVLAETITTVMDGYLAESGWEADPNPVLADSSKAARHFAELIVLYVTRALDVDLDSKTDGVKNELEKLWRSVAGNLDREWSVAEMAEKVNMSESTLRRQTLKHFGVTPWRMVMDMRMRQADMLVSETDYPMKLISERLGYADEFVFSTAFKKHHGHPPSKHKRREKREA